jgi:hypothetical protein
METMHILKIICHTDDAPIKHKCDGCDYTTSIDIRNEKQARAELERIKDSLDSGVRRGQVSTYILIANFAHFPWVWEAEGS